MRNQILVCAAITASLGAQDLRTLGLQVRASVPTENVAESTGKKTTVGASLQAEVALEGGYHWRVALGGDRWGPGPWTNRPGVTAEVSAAHLEFEFIKLLRPDVEPDHLGPYLMAGVRFVGWNVKTTDRLADLRKSRNVTHVAGSVGFGYRFAPWLDVELKTFYGRIDPDFSGGAFSFGLTYRF